MEEGEENEEEMEEEEETQKSLNQSLAMLWGVREHWAHPMSHPFGYKVSVPRIVIALASQEELLANTHIGCDHTWSQHGSTLRPSAYSAITKRFI